MLKDDNRIQLDLHSALEIDKILLGDTELKIRSATTGPSSSTFRRR